MRRFLIAVLAIAVLVCQICPVTAEIISTENEIVIVDRYTITEDDYCVLGEKDSAGRVTTSYVKNIDEEDDLRANDYASLKALLKDMGMGESFIAELSDEQLELYAGCKSMVGMTVITGDSDVEADAGLMNDYASNEEVNLFLLVTYLGNNRYLFSTDAEWFGVPNVKRTDSLGISATNIGDVLASTRAGWYSYSTSDGESVRTDKTSESFHEAGITGWYGSCMSFDLSNDVENNLKLHYEYQWIITPSETITRFDVAASYDHTTSNWGWDTSVTMKNRNNVGVMELTNDSNADLLMFVKEDIIFVSN